MNKKLIATLEGRTFVIESDLPRVGAYLRIYENEKDIGDYLQYSVQDCIEFALEDFQVPTDAWHELE